MPNRSTVLVVLCVVMLGASVPVLGEQQPDFQRLAAEAQAEADAHGAAVSTGNPTLDAHLAELTSKYYDAKLAFDLVSLEHTRRTLNQQYVMSIIISIVVLTIVMTGLGLSVLQFQSGRRSETVTSIEIGSAGLKITSPVLGLLILVVSIAFFYQYLGVVYTIHSVPSP